MATKRMFSIDVVDTDKFLDMPISAQCLYFHLGMHADDDGFVSSPKKIAKAANCGNDDLRILVSKDYLIPFDDGVVVITDWRVNNYIRTDRYKTTIHDNKKAVLKLEENGRYTIGIPTVDERYTQYSIDKSSIDKDRLERGSNHPTPTVTM